MAYVVDICFEKVDIKDKIKHLNNNDKHLQSIIAYNNFYNTLLANPESEECESLQTFILYHPSTAGDSQAFVNMNIFANNLLKLKKNVFFLRFIKGKRRMDPDYPEFSIPVEAENNTDDFNQNVTELKTRIVDFGDPEIDITLASRFPDVVIPPCWFMVQEDNLRVGGGGNNWYKFVRKIEILWKKKPLVIAAIYDFQVKPKKLLAELCKCRKRAEFLKLDYTFSGDEVCEEPQVIAESDEESDDEHLHKAYRRPGALGTTDAIEYDKSVWDGVWNGVAARE